MDPHGLEWRRQKYHRCRHLRHHPAEGFRRLVHRPPDESDIAQVECDKEGKKYLQSSFRRRSHLISPAHLEPGPRPAPGTYSSTTLRPTHTRPVATDKENPSAPGNRDES